MKVKFPIIIIIFLFWSCSSWKDMMVADGNQNDAINNAIFDFIHSYKNEKDSVFYIYTKDINKQILGVNISKTYDKVLVSTDDSVNYSYHGFPSELIKMDGKIFYWHDTTKTVSDEIICILTEYNLVDTMIVNVYIPESIIDHSKKGVDYYFCKENLLKFKKVRTKKAIGYYEPPILECN